MILMIGRLAILKKEWLKKQATTRLIIPPRSRYCRTQSLHGAVNSRSRVWFCLEKKKRSGSYCLKPRLFMNGVVHRNRFIMIFARRGERHIFSFTMKFGKRFMRVISVHRIKRDLYNKKCWRLTRNHAAKLLITQLHIATTRLAGVRFLFMRLLNHSR